MIDEPDPPSGRSLNTHATQTRIERVAAIIRNGLSNSPIAQSQAAWDCLQTRLGEIARAILEEI